MAESAHGDARAAGRASFAAGAERLARSDPRHSVTQKHWDLDPWLLGCPGATVDLQTGEARTPNAADYITRLTSCAPADDETCPRWQAFLEEASGDDAEMIRFLQQFCGYSLTGITREHALLFLEGPGGNGKSVFINTVLGVLGEYAQVASMDTLAASKSDRHPTDLARLRGARLVSASETEEGQALAEARIKILTGGDPITARFMRQDSFTYLPLFKLMIVGNHTPALRNVDEAMRRRINIVPFNRKPKFVDRELEKKLRAEGPGILRWMINGWVDWMRNGLIRPCSVVNATADYFIEQDVFGQWLADECMVEVGNEARWELTGDLFESWRRHAGKAGEEPGNANRFAQNMLRHRFTKAIVKDRGKSTRIWRGVALMRNVRRAYDGGPPGSHRLRLSRLYPIRARITAQ